MSNLHQSGKYGPVLHSRGGSPHLDASILADSSTHSFSSRCILLFPRIDLLDLFQASYWSNITATKCWEKCRKEVATTNCLVRVAPYQIVIVIVTQSNFRFSASISFSHGEIIMSLSWVNSVNASTRAAPCTTPCGRRLLSWLLVFVWVVGS